ncbi:MAG: DinB family protein [Caldilineaceae bacterium]
MSIQAVINSQFHAGLDMLEQTIARCPESVWTDTAPKNKTWHIAYHALFYVHLYLQPTEADFVPWAKHRENYNTMGGRLSYPPFAEVVMDRPYRQAEMLDYLALCRAEVDKQTAQMDLDAPSGFDWLPFGKLELQFYSLRHLMMHIGEIADRLGSQGIDVDWRGQKGDG